MKVPAGSPQPAKKGGKERRQHFRFNLDKARLIVYPDGLLVKFGLGRQNRALTALDVSEGGLQIVVTDRGRQFTSARFRSFVRRLGVRRRYAAVGDGNLSRIDRLWRSMMEEFARGLFLFRPIATLEGQLRSYARWHALGRPHQGLGLRVPGDVHAGMRKRRLRRVERAGLEVTHLDDDPRLPIFHLRRAA